MQIQALVLIKGGERIEFGVYAASPVGKHTTLYIGGKVYRRPEKK